MSEAARAIAAGEGTPSERAPSEMARTSDVVSASLPVSDEARRVDALPPGVLVARVGAGANCSSAGSAIDILFYTSVIAGAIAVALSAAFPPRAVEPPGGESGPPPEPPSGDDPAEEMR